MNPEINTEEIYKQTADTILETSVPIRITIRPHNRWEKLLQHLKITPTEKVFFIRPLCLGTLIKISEVILSIDSTNLNDVQGDIAKAYNAIVKNTATIIRVTGIAIQNCEEEPPAKLLAMIRSEFTAQDLAKTLAVVLHKMDIKSFMISIISVRGLNVIEKAEKSPSDQGS